MPATPSQLRAAAISFTGSMEGFRGSAYRDTVGKLTIGYGHNLDDKPISTAAGQFILGEDVDDAMALIYGVCKRFGVNFDQLPGKVQLALVDMCFNLGPNKLRYFVNMMQAIAVGDFATASAQAQASLWYKQVGKRGDADVQLLLGGELA
jgi:lysozyme